MEAFGAKDRGFYGPVSTEMRGVGKRSLEWDLNDWKWDGDLFTACPLNSVSDCRGRQLFPGTPSNAAFSNSCSSGSDDVVHVGNENGTREAEKRRRGDVVGNGEVNDEGRSLNLNLGGQTYAIIEGEGNGGKKTKIAGNSNRAACQVEDCRADLSSAKDYHRRHKVCVMHSKASEALVGNVMQRFCQQCSRFHVLKEFDEGKRSCRRRLAGHNKTKNSVSDFTACPLNSVSDCRGRQLFPGTPSNAAFSNSCSSGSDDVVHVGNENGTREAEKRRHGDVVGNGEVNDEGRSLNLNLGGQTYAIIEGEGNGGKKTKIAGNSNRAACQVEDCRADLSSAKDYHRRHMVCVMHSKASEALVGNVMQRFCQQCSRFHVLKEFDEGKRSCRRRLAGHNKRRRKTLPDTAVNAGPMSANSSDQAKDQDLLSHLLKSLASLSGTADRKNITALLQASGLPNIGSSTKIAQQVPDTVSNYEPSRPSVSTSSMDDCVIIEQPPMPVGKCPKLLEIDLNSPYNESHDDLGEQGSCRAPINPGIHHDSHKSSPPQTSGNSDSTFTQSPSSSSGESQNRTDRIVFKLFGKYPNELPYILRSQIFDWLSHSPTEIESYIRPGCIVLTIYLRLEESMWAELCCNLGSNLQKLLDAANDSFWRAGWIYSRMQHSVAFMYNGQVVLNAPLPLKSHKSSWISSIKPIAACSSEKAEFVVKGFNLPHSTGLLCALEGEYLLQDVCDDLIDDADTTVEGDELQCLRFSCSIPNVTGRGFIEVEDLGLSSSFFPFIVAEQEVCSEICMLENVIEAAERADDIEAEPEILETKNQAMDFIHEMGWLLHRSHVKFRLGHLDPNLHLFPFRRFKLLMVFSVDHDWCAVVKKLLKLLFDRTVDAGEHSSVELALLDMALLHRAVRRNSRPMVEFLLRFVPDKGLEYEQKKQVGGWGNSFLFKPDGVGPLGLTPLHIAASIDGCEQVLDALTDDPSKVGIEAWKNARDSTGMTPYDYASMQGRYSYINLIQRKISKKPESGHVVLDIPGTNLETNSKPKQSDGHRSSKVASFDTEKFDIKAIIGENCKLCSQKLAYGSRRSLVYRPAMLSMVAVAAVCVCVALLFKSTPEVVFIFHPFRWEHLKFGSS